MIVRYWIKCARLYGKTRIYYASREARDAAAAQLIGQGFGCAFNN